MLTSMLLILKQGLGMKDIANPLSMKYVGNETDSNVIDAIQFGESIGGAGRVYTSVAHFCTFGEVLKPRQQTELRCYASVPKEGCYEAILVVATAANQYQLFSDLYKPAMGWLMAKITKHIKDSLIGRGNDMELAKEIIEQGKRSHELNTILANGLIKSHQNTADAHEKLIDALPQLVEANTSRMKNLVAPVGRSCSELRQFSGTKNEFSITEPEAAVIRSEQELEVGDMADYDCVLISELNIRTGHCNLEIDGIEKTVTGKINDPALNEPNNIYSQSLNDHIGFVCTAKPILKDGEIHKLYISDAKST